MSSQSDPDPVVIVRRYRPDDRPALVVLAPELEVGVAPWRPSLGVAAAALDWVNAAVDGAQRPDRAVFVAVHDDRPRGFVGVSERVHFSGQAEAYIGELVVHRHYRRRGIAAALVAEAERWAAQRGLARLTLETGCANRGALEFYDRAGFEREQVMLSRAVGGLRAPS